jgi:hypothetical protein
MVLPLGQLSPLDKDQLVMKLKQLNSGVKQMALDPSEGMKPLVLVLIKMVPALAALGSPLQLLLRGLLPLALLLASLLLVPEERLLKSTSRSIQNCNH